MSDAATARSLPVAETGTAAPEHPLRARRPWYALLALVALLAAAVRLYGISRSDPWLDEAWSWLVASPPLTEVLRLIAEDNNSPLYYVILHGVTVIPNASWGMYRLPSAVTAMLTLLPVVALAGRMGGRGAALAAALLFALHPVNIFYAQTARVYAMQTLCFGLAIDAFARGWRGWGIWLAVALYLHPLGILLLPGVWVMAVTAPRAERGRSLRLAAIGTAVGIGLFLPWLPIMLRQSTHSVTDYLSEIWARSSAWVVPARSVGITMGVDRLPSDVLYPRIADAYPPALLTGPGRLCVAGLVLAVCGMIGLCAWRSDRARQVAAGFVAMLGTHVLLSEFVRPVLLLGRHDSPYVAVLVPLAAAALCGTGLSGRSRRACGVLLFALVLALNTWWTVRYHLSPPHRHQPTTHAAAAPG